MNNSLKVKALAVVLFFGTAVSPTMAENIYGALDVGQSKAKDACVGATSVCDTTANLFRVAGGYQFDPMWSAEISYGASRKASLGILLPGIAGAWEVDVLQLSGVGTFPLGSGFALTAKLGVARTDLTLTAAGADVSSSTTKASLGIGARYDFTDNFAIRAQYEDLGKVGDANKTGTSKVTFISAGAMFKF